MGYKTFEDMKHNIPEGATHYRNECESFLFTWFKETDSGIKFYEEVSQNWSLIGRHVNNLKSKMVKIPSQTETPEEKEALDMIDTTSKQVESLANNSEFPNGSEWNNGDECIYMTHNVVHQFIGPCPKREGYGYIQAPGFEVNFVELSKLSKPETPHQREERERLEAAYDLCTTVYPDFSGFDEFKKATTIVDLWLAIVDKTGYRKD